MSINLSGETIGSIVCAVIVIIILAQGFRISTRGKGKDSKGSSSSSSSNSTSSTGSSTDNNVKS